MKKIILFTFILLCVSIRSQSYYNQYFDGANVNPNNSFIIGIGTNTNNIWQVGKPQKTLFSSASTTPNVIVTDTINYYPNNNVSTFTFIAVPGCGLCVYALQWKQKLDMLPDSAGGI